MSPPAGGHIHMPTDFEGSEGAGWVSARASSYNPFQSGMKPIEKFNLEMDSKEFDVDKP